MALEFNQWYDVIGYPAYEIFCDGVKTFLRRKERKEEKAYIYHYVSPQKKSLCTSMKYLKHWFSCGYPTVTLTHLKKRKHFTFHRLVAIHFIDNPENKPHINHIDGDKLNYDLLNLEWVTQTENNRHARETKLNFGKSATNLTQQQVDEIIRLYKIHKNYSKVSRILSYTLNKCRYHIEKAGILIVNK